MRQINFPGAQRLQSRMFYFPQHTESWRIIVAIFQLNTWAPLKPVIKAHGGLTPAPVTMGLNNK